MTILKQHEREIIRTRYPLVLAKRGISSLSILAKLFLILLNPFKANWVQDQCKIMYAYFIQPLLLLTTLLMINNSSHPCCRSFSAEGWQEKKRLTNPSLVHALPIWRQYKSCLWFLWFSFTWMPEIWNTSQVITNVNSCRNKSLCLSKGVGRFPPRSIPFLPPARLSVLQSTSF